MGIASKPYLKLQKELHDTNPAYGSSGHYHVGWATRLAAKYNARTVLDYGCGKQTLKDALPAQYEYTPYDPAFPELARPPAQADIVVCFDVLEHIEPNFIKPVLKDLRRVTRFAALMTISTQLASKTLSDGRNAHLIVQPAIWWLMQLDAHFELQAFENLEAFFVAEVTPR